MRHADASDDRIQDPDGIIPADEPVFLMRGSDRHAAQAVRDWAAAVLANGGDRAVVSAAHRHARLMEAWYAAHQRHE